MIVIREYKDSDASALFEIVFNTVRVINRRDYSQAQVEAWAPYSQEPANWKQRMKSLAPFVAVMDDVVVGYADLQPCGLIDHFFCHHEYQGQGVGKALMAYVLAVGEQRGVRRYYSNVSITARPFYERFGFMVIQEQWVDMRGQKLKNFVMEYTTD
ncbi:GNAT family N-acetyltransferase [Vibrio sp. YMD68]|uniref:GNAT family N-acetyltransferase n=1 Tax=Vibrio sp. YMD68 TaxID=3042300 RepID=UPI00249C6B90|nr:GNAT family N-acetyltransferase [Vibrio sp. YMD68]WGV97927.1 GNAT family N-acetyltransferase [Vibrio sp. YMD68]